MTSKDQHDKQGPECAVFFQTLDRRILGHEKLGTLRNRHEAASNFFEAAMCHMVSR